MFLKRLIIRGSICFYVVSTRNTCRLCLGKLSVLRNYTSRWHHNFWLAPIFLFDFCNYFFCPLPYPVTSFLNDSLMVLSRQLIFLSKTVGYLLIYLMIWPFLEVPFSSFVKFAILAWIMNFGIKILSEFILDGRNSSFIYVTSLLLISWFFSNVRLYWTKLLRSTEAAIPRYFWNSCS